MQGIIGGFDLSSHSYGRSHSIVCRLGDALLL